MLKRFFIGGRQVSEAEYSDARSGARPSVGLGDLVERVAKPIGRALRLNCYDEAGNLRPESGCGKRKAALNRIRLPEIR